MKQYLMVFLLSWSCLLSAAELPDWLQQVAAEKHQQPEAMLQLLQQHYQVPPALLCYCPFLLDERSQMSLPDFSARQHFIAIGK